MNARTTRRACCVLLAALCGGPAWAAGGGGGGGAGGGSRQPAAPRDADFDAGVAAWKREDWAEVRMRMGAVVERAPDNADAWNYLGHAARQQGKLEQAFKDYDRALAIDPKHKGAHEYAGEAELMAGRLERAEAHLRALDKICFFPCEEYTELKEKIERFKRSK